VPEGTVDSASTRDPTKLTLRHLRGLTSNRPFVALIGVYALCGLALGIWYGMIFIYVDIYLKKGALFAPLYLIAFGVGVAATLIWSLIAGRIGKKAAWSIGMGLAFVTFVGTSSLNPGNANPWTLGFLLIVNTLGLTSFELLPASLLGDVVDFGLLTSGRNQAATYFAVYMFVTKVVFALGGSIALGLASWLGFEPHAGAQTGQGVFALQMVMSWVPGVLMVIGIVFIPRIPMDERRHAMIRKRLSARADRGLTETETHLTQRHTSSAASMSSEW
jgi:Na+/melibiose symporter-like transporter